MPKLSTLATRTYPLEFEHDGDDYRLTYRPITGEAIDRLSENDEGEAGTFNQRFLLATLSTWNMEDDAGQTLPVTLATVRALPLAIQALLVEKIMEDSQVGKQSGKRSVATSTPTAASALAPTGISGSAPPTASTPTL